MNEISTFILSAKFLGSLGVLFTAYGFLLISGEFIFIEGLGGMLAQEIYGSPLGFWERLLTGIFYPFFRFIGTIRKTHPYERSDMDIRNIIQRKKEVRILFGCVFILFGSIMQIIAYWR